MPSTFPRVEPRQFTGIPGRASLTSKKGHLRVINHDTGEVKDFRPGEVLSEAVGQWHEGRAIEGPVRLIVFDIVPPGVTNVSAQPAKE